MKNGMKVKVVACITGHEFDINEIVERHEAEYDYEMKDSLGFISKYDEIWYMIPDEYEVLDILDGKEEGVMLK